MLKLQKFRIDRSDMSNKYNTITLEKSESIATITLNRPERLNAINIELGYEFLDALNDCEMDDDVRCIILTGTGRSFCAGDDLKGMENDKFPRETGPDEVKHYTFGANRWTLVVNAMRRLAKPIIGSLRGHAHGGGFNLAMGTDIRIASNTLDMAIPFIKWAQATGANQLHYHIGIGLTLELAFTGDSINAERAERLGLINKIVPDDKLEEETLAFAKRLANGPTRSIGLTKSAIYKGWNKDLDTAFDYQGIAQVFARQSEDHAEGRLAFSEKRKPEFKGQ
ncbi:MAG: enoyl-CoA hydratase/isomerase family protein [SAR202 cluster bacterium]|nr:enoyl-CoA hydratase/isomerase family protein [SAR202 cluster bacterium]